MTGSDRFHIDVPAAHAAFTAIGAAAIASDFESPASCGDDVFTAAFSAAVASMQAAEKKDEAMVMAAEMAAAERGQQDVANYETQDARNGADLSTTGVLI